MVRDRSRGSTPRNCCPTRWSRCTADRSCRFVYLYLGAGLGAAIYLANELVRGAHGLAGEIGWLPTSVTGPHRILARHIATATDTAGDAAPVGATRVGLDAARYAALATLSA